MSSENIELMPVRPETISEEEFGRMLNDEWTGSFVEFTTLVEKLGKIEDVRKISYVGFIKTYFKGFILWTEYGHANGHGIATRYMPKARAVRFVFYQDPARHHVKINFETMDGDIPVFRAMVWPNEQEWHGKTVIRASVTDELVEKKKRPVYDDGATDSEDEGDERFSRE
jgi:hypothetical protein